MQLEVRDLTKDFPAVRALDGVSLDFRSGEVHGLIGENGAGKSTLMKILAGIYEPTTGFLLLDGEPLRVRGPADAIRRGIVMIHQELNLVDELTAAENIFLGREPTRAGLVDYRKMMQEAQHFLRDVGATFAPNTRVGDLTIASKQLVEIAKAVSYEARVIIMDEPTAVLSAPEIESLFDLIRKLREKGVAVVYISHILGEVLEICDRITVLRDGQVVAEADPKIATPSSLAEAMVGRELQDVFPPKQSLPDVPPILRVSNLSVEGHVSSVGFELRPGEILGLAGLVGSGRTESAEAIVGVRPRTSGEIELEGQILNIRSARDSLRAGIAYVSEDRKATGLVLSMNTVENVTLANLSAYAHPIVESKKEIQTTEKYIEKFRIKVGDMFAPVVFLSGGNQQKVAVSKWLDTSPKVLILDEPTRGIDVGSKREIYNLIHDLAAAGMACVVISSEMPELIGICHRIIVLRGGSMAGEVSGEGMTEQNIMYLAAGVEAP